MGRYSVYYGRMLPGGKMKRALGIVLVWAAICPAFAFSHLEAQFRQVRESRMFNEPQVLTGRFEYDVPDQVTWKYDSGVQAQLPEPMLRFIAKAVDGSYLQQSDDFIVEQSQNEVTLTPKKPRLKKLFSQIVIRFAGDGLAEQVVMTEATGDTTTIFFLNMTAR